MADISKLDIEFYGPNEVAVSSIPEIVDVCNQLFPTRKTIIVTFLYKGYKIVVEAPRYRDAYLIRVHVYEGTEDGGYSTYACNEYLKDKTEAEFYTIDLEKFQDFLLRGWDIA